MKRTKFTYGQLEKALRALGFKCHTENSDPPSRIYLHQKSGATVMLPVFPESDKVYEHHLVIARMEVEDFGIADAKTFEAKLRKVG